jgi:hypothetical protein
VERHQLGRTELGEGGVTLLCEPKRLRVERLLEECAREACVPEALAALDAVEDPRELRLGVRRERVLVACGDVPRDLEQLAGRVVGEDDLAREARAQTGIRVEEAVHEPGIAGNDHDEAVSVVLHPLENRLDRLGPEVELRSARRE